MANVVNALLKNQPRKGRSWPWKPTGRAPRRAAEAGRGAACSGSSKLEVSSSACSAGTKGGRTAGERMRGGSKRGKGKNEAAMDRIVKKNRKNNKHNKEKGERKEEGRNGAERWEPRVR